MVAQKFQTGENGVQLRFFAGERAELLQVEVDGLGLAGLDVGLQRRIHARGVLRREDNFRWRHGVAFFPAGRRTRANCNSNTIVTRRRLT